MAIDWNAHRFSGGALALDLINTVIYRQDPSRSIDRFADASEIDPFAQAALHFRQAELGDMAFSAEGHRQAPAIVCLRETMNTLFRDAVVTGTLAPRVLSDFLGQGAGFTAGLPDNARLTLDPTARLQTELPLGAAAFLSGLRLVSPARLSRVRICPNCHWLYLDESRNRSRRWCDMSVCGNRAKAKRHYLRNRLQDGAGDGPH